MSKADMMTCPDAECGWKGPYSDCEHHMRESLCPRCRTVVLYTKALSVPVKALPRIGDRIRTLTDNLDTDEDDNERTTPAGAVGEVFRVERRGEEGVDNDNDHFHVTFPDNGAWLVFHPATDSDDYETIEGDGA